MHILAQLTCLDGESCNSSHHTSHTDQSRANRISGQVAAGGGGNQLLSVAMVSGAPAPTILGWQSSHLLNEW